MTSVLEADANLSPHDARIRRPAAIYVLIAILLVGLGLRLFRLGAWEIGIDEAYSAEVAALSIPDLLEFAAADDFHPPLYYIFLHYWRRLGTEERLLRLPSVAFSVAAIVVLYDLTRRIAGEESGLLAGLILALSPLHIYHAQDIRMYALLLLLATLSLWFAVRLVVGDTRRLMWVGYVVITTLALYTHYGAFILVVGQNLAIAALFALRRVRFVWQWVASQLIILAGYLPWLLIFLSRFSQTGTEDVAAVSSLGIVHQYAFVLSAFASYLLPMGTPALKAILAGIFALVALIGVISLRRTLPAATLLASSSFVALAVVGAVFGWRTLNATGGHIFMPRPLLAVSVAYYVLVASALIRMRPRVLAGFVLLLLVAANIYSYPQLYYGVQRAGPWREVARDVAANLQTGDGIVFVSGFWARPFDFYFSTHGTPVPSVRYHGLGFLQEVTNLAGNSRRIWLLLKQPQAVDPRGLVRTHINSMATLTQEKEYPFGIRVELYQVGQRP